MTDVPDLEVSVSVCVFGLALQFSVAALFVVYCSQRGGGARAGDFV